MFRVSLSPRPGEVPAVVVCARCGSARHTRALTAGDVGETEALYLCRRCTREKYRIQPQ